MLPGDTEVGSTAVVVPTAMVEIAGASMFAPVIRQLLAAHLLLVVQLTVTLAPSDPLATFQKIEVTSSLASLVSLSTSALHPEGVECVSVLALRMTRASTFPAAIEAGSTHALFCAAVEPAVVTPRAASTGLAIDSAPYAFASVRVKPVTVKL